MSPITDMPIACSGAIDVVVEVGNGAVGEEILSESHGSTVQPELCGVKIRGRLQTNRSTH